MLENPLFEGRGGRGRDVPLSQTPVGHSLRTPPETDLLHPTPTRPHDLLVNFSTRDTGRGCCHRLSVGFGQDMSTFRISVVLDL